MKHFAQLFYFPLSLDEIEAYIREARWELRTEKMPLYLDIEEVEVGEAGIPALILSTAPATFHD